MIRIAAALMLIIPATGIAESARTPEVTIYAAVSLRDALVEIAPACERSTGTRLVFNFGASSTLARQIQAAGRADLFLSADADWMDRLDRAGLIEDGSRRALLSNRLVVVAPAGIGPSIVVSEAGDLAGPAVRRLSIAQPDVVPAGRYARAWLEAEGVWDRLEDRIVPALDARAAIAAVEAGAADAGVVYATDAALSRRVRIVYQVPAAAGPRIEYHAAALRGGPSPRVAREALACLAGAEAAAVFRRFGFAVIAGGGPVTSP